MAEGTIFVFSREVEGTLQRFTQTAVVSAGDRDEAYRALSARLGHLRNAEDDDDDSPQEEPGYEPDRGWRIDEYPLSDDPKVLTVSVVQWPGAVAEPLP